MRRDRSEVALSDIRILAAVRFLQRGKISPFLLFSALHAIIVRQRHQTEGAQGGSTIGLSSVQVSNFLAYIADEAFPREKRARSTDDRCG